MIPFAHKKVACTARLDYVILTGRAPRFDKESVMVAPSADEIVLLLGLSVFAVFYWRALLVFVAVVMTLMTLMGLLDFLALAMAR